MPALVPFFFICSTAIENSSLACRGVRRASSLISPTSESEPGDRLTRVLAELFIGPASIRVGLAGHSLNQNYHRAGHVIVLP